MKADAVDAYSARRPPKYAAGGDGADDPRIHHSFSIDLSILDANQGGASTGPEAYTWYAEDRSGTTTRSCAESGESGDPVFLDKLAIAYRRGGQTSGQQRAMYGGGVAPMRGFTGKIELPADGRS